MSCDHNTPAVVGERERGRVKPGANVKKQYQRKKDRGRGKLTFDGSDVNYFRG